MGEEAVKMTEEEAGRRLMPDNHDDHDDHFVLVHGISGGSWCWYKIRCLLENSGYKVSCIDLKASGIDPSQADTILSFQDYNKPFMDLMSSLPDHHKVILVGHSAGGLSITEATHKFGEKIRLAIYLGATMLKTGFSTEQDVKDGVPDLSEFGDVYEVGFGVGTDQPPTSALVKKEFQRQIIYQMSPPERHNGRQRVAAINSFCAALGNPLLPGWVASAGDPCAEAWQGVQCNTNNSIISITLIGANLGGQQGTDLGSFTSIQTIDLSNNHIGGSIPTNLPVTLLTFFLSDNHFTGGIPSSLSSLSQLQAISLNDNQITRDIPDAFQGLTGLVNLDLSRNNLSGQLPTSLENLSSLTTLRLQNNQLSGALDVLQDLPLRDLYFLNHER